MATYKVAQDVEADDKLIGPFSFRQFIYLIIVAMSGAMAWGLAQIFVGLAIIPMPAILFFGALALPLKKDQPMETYLAAVMSYYLKPRKRLWEPDGIDSLVEVTAPKVIESHLTKDLSSTEAERRLSYLADIADTEGWAVRHLAKPFMNNSAIIDDVYNEAQTTPDILDDTGATAQALGTRITQADAQRRQNAMASMQQAIQQQTQPVQPPIMAPATGAFPPQQQQELAPYQQPEMPAEPIAPPQQPVYYDPYQNLQQPEMQPVQSEPETPVRYDPYPTSIRQSVVRPLDETTPQPPASQQPYTPPATMPALQPAPIAPQQPETYQPPIFTPEAPAQPAPKPQLSPESTKSTSETPVSPDIIDLANNSDLSIETIQHEANRRMKKKAEADDGEVFISLH